MGALLGWCIPDLGPNRAAAAGVWPRWSHWRHKDTDSVVAVSLFTLNAIMTIAAVRGPPPATGDCAGNCPFDFVSVRACVGEATASVLALLTVLLPMLHSRFTQ